MPRCEVFFEDGVAQEARTALSLRCSRLALSHNRASSEAGVND